MEIAHFDVHEGARFLLHLLSNRNHSAQESEPALELSRSLNGHALAINQMAAYINSQTMSVEAFLPLYAKYPKRLYRERKAGWKYLGYDHGLDTVWDISFGSLEKSALSCLGVLSFLMPDSIPFVLLEPPSAARLKETLKYCQDELE